MTIFQNLPEIPLTTIDIVLQLNLDWSYAWRKTFENFHGIHVECTLYKDNNVAVLHVNWIITIAAKFDIVSGIEDITKGYQNTECPTQNLFMHTSVKSCLSTPILQCSELNLKPIIFHHWNSVQITSDS